MLLIPLGAANAGRGFMKRLRPSLQAVQEKRRKKKIRRRKLLKTREAKKSPHTEQAAVAPRWMRRKRALIGTSYWRGDRSVLEGYK